MAGTSGTRTYIVNHVWDPFRHDPMSMTCSRVPLVPILVASAMLGELPLPEIINLGGCLIKILSEL